MIADEVYDALMYDGKKYHPFAGYKDNWERTMTIYSAGKLLNCTGWKLGWIIGPKAPVKEATLMHEIAIYNVNVPGQAAIAKSLPLIHTPYQGKPTYIDYQRSIYQSTKD